MVLLLLVGLLHYYDNDINHDISCVIKRVLAMLKITLFLHHLLFPSQKMV